MKKIFSILLTVVMFISNGFVVCANETVELYAYTTDTSGYDEYASEKFAGFIYGHYGIADTTLELGKGITIINENDYPKVLYPVWKNNEIVATFIVVNVEGVYSGTYRENTYLLNDIIAISDQNHAFYLFSNEDGFYAVVNGNAYDMNASINESVEVKLPSQNIINNCNIINSIEKTETKALSSVNSSARANPNSVFMNEWTTYYYDSDGSVLNHCYTFCLYNIFYNLGIRDYTFNDIRTGILLGLGTANISQIEDWLDSKNISYSSASSGCLAYTSVYDYLCTEDNYIMVGLTYQIDSDTIKRHFMAMYGCSYLTGITTYSLWDPESHEIDSLSEGKVTMDGDTKLVVNVENTTLKWDGGYIANFSK